jgi:hypothetical protein
MVIAKITSWANTYIPARKQGSPFCLSLSDDGMNHSSNVVEQELAGNLKAEVRDLLARKGITKFVIKPVKRNYAFDNQNVPRGEQWVLKIRYDASLPMLDLGLTGVSAS